jgi:hypothetical protein
MGSGTNVTDGEFAKLLSQKERKTQDDFQYEKEFLFVAERTDRTPLHQYRPQVPSSF